MKACRTPPPMIHRFRKSERSLLVGLPEMSDLRLSGLRDLRNFVTLAESPAVASPLTRYRLFQLQFKFLSTKDDA